MDVRKERHSRAVHGQKPQKVQKKRRVGKERSDTGNAVVTGT